MVEKFQNSLKKCAKASDKVLLAVSGGMDSVAMCYLFHHSAMEFGIAHCNFQLRGADADGDEAFVRNLAQELGVTFHTIAFDTRSIQQQRKGSIQMIARDLRYEWLEKIRQEHEYGYIATAHHLNDSLETALYNLTKGTGVNGLKGILQKNGNIIRPMIAFSRQEIEDYILAKKIRFREDSSNAEDKYARNRIRHHVIPVLKKINPQLEYTFLNTSKNIMQAASFIKQQIQKIKNQYAHQKGELIFVNKKIFNEPQVDFILYEWLSPYGFNGEQVQDLNQMVHGESGSRIFSETHRIVNDREYFILERKRDADFNEIQYLIHEKEIPFSTDGLIFEFKKKSKPESFEKKYWYLDFNALVFPLVVRRWKQGDAFYPLGMNGRKKVSKFFKDRKYSIPEKENAWILESNGQVCAILGDRVDERVKVSEQTQFVLRISMREISG